MTFMDQPSKIICCGPNFPGHFPIKPYFVEPQFFVRTPNTLCKFNNQVYLPADAAEIKGEAEIAIVIGDNLLRGELFDINIIEGIVLANDITILNYAKDDLQWFRAKCIDNSCPVSNKIIPFEPQADYILETRINNKLIQSFRYCDIINKPLQIIQYLNKFVTLNRGDLILTGSETHNTYLNHEDIIKVSLFNRKKEVLVIENQIIINES